jgi:hypothetical protein
LGALCSDGGSQRIAIAGHIAHHDLGWEALDERRGLRRITGLACRQEETDRAAQAADGHMDFYCQAAARTSDG